MKSADSNLVYENKLTPQKSFAKLNSLKKDKGSDIGLDQTQGVKKVFDFKIAGVSYKIKSSHDEKTLAWLVDFVNEKVNEAMKATKNSSFQNAAVLASLNIAEEMLLLKRKAWSELNHLETKAQQLSEVVESTKSQLTHKEVDKDVI